MRYVSSTILREVRIFLPIAAAIGAALALSGCSLKPASNRTLRLEIPGGSTAAISASRMDSSSIQTGGVSGSAPASFSEFACYMVAVSGPGIQDDPRIGCPGVRGPIGILNGMVPVTGGVLEISVPAGPARHVRLLAATNTGGGCPDINAVMEANRTPGGIDRLFPGLGKPLEIGSKTVDLFNDVDVSITAAYDPQNPLKVFGECNSSGEGVPLPISSALRGSAPYAQSFDYTVSPYPAQDGISTVFSPVAFTAAEIAKVSTMKVETAPGVLPNADTNNSVFQQVQGDGTISQRAMVQFQWDVTALSPANYKSLDLQLQIKGGHSGTCPGASNTGVQAAILRTDGTWHRLSMINTQNALAWSSTYQLDPAQFFYLTPGTGQKTIIVNVDSNLRASTAPCTSEVAIGGVQLRLYKEYGPMHVSVGPEGALYAPGVNVYPFTTGGHPPYTYTVDVGGMLGTGTPYYTVPQGIASAVITATDVDGRIAQVVVRTGNYWALGTPDMSAVRQSHRLVKLLDGKFLIMGGDQDPSADTAQVFDPATETFSASITMNDKRGRPAVVLLPDGKVWVSGGQFLNTAPALVSTEIFDPTTQVFTGTAPMSNARYGHTATLMSNGKIYINGGMNLSGTCWNLAKTYNPTTDTYNTATSIGPSANAVAVLLQDGRVAVIGGQSDCSSTLMPNIHFYASDDTTAIGPTLAVPRFDHTATLLPNGKVLIAGGLAATALDSVELFDPVANTVTSLNPMRIARRGHVALLLPNGKVMFVSGQTDNFPYQIPDAEIYDPATGNSVAVGGLGAGRSLLVGGVSDGGIPYIFGGYTYSSGETASWERFFF